MSHGKKRLLFVVPYNPILGSAGAQGPKNVSSPLISFLSKSFDLHLVVISDDASLSPKDLINIFPNILEAQVLKPYSGFRRAIIRLIYALQGVPPALCEGNAPGLRKLLRKYSPFCDLIHFEYFTLASNICSVQKFCPVQIHGHDAYSLYQNRRLKYSGNNLQAVKSLILRFMFNRLESTLLAKADSFLVVSPIDAAYLKTKGLINVSYLPPALGLSPVEGYASASNNYGTRDLLVYVPPGMQLIEVDQIINALQDAIKELKVSGFGQVAVTFLGKGVDLLREKVGESISAEYIYFVNDYFAFLSSRKWIFVYPVRAGAGLHTKLRDVMLLGHPVIGFREIMAAFGGHNFRDYVECNSGSDLSRSVVQLLLREDLSGKIGLAGKEFIIDRFGESSVVAKYLEIFSGLKERNKYRNSVDVDLSRLHSVQRQISNLIADICDRHDIRYFLIAGTLLGAVRHGDFIPWDDDLDIGMVRSDYDRFLAVAQSELGNDYFLQTYFTDKNMPFSFAKIRANGTVLKESTSAQSEWHQGIYVDVFPFDPVPKSIWRKCLQKVSYRVVFLLLLAQCGFMPTSRNFYVIKKVVYSGLFRPISKLLGRDRLVRAQEYVSRFSDECASGKLVALGGSYGYERETVDSAWFQETVKLRFGESEMRCPAGWSDYLKNLYGDYMRLPPHHQRVSRHGIVFVKFKDSL